MENNMQRWSEKTKAIFNGVLIYSISKVVYAIFDPINSAEGVLSGMLAFADGGSYNSGSGALDIICWLALAGVIVGYFLFLKGLSDFRALLTEKDSLAINRIRIGVILGLVATIVFFIPFMGLAGTILDIIAFILMLLGYSALKNSGTFPAKAVKGASRLFVSMIFALIGAILGFIPFVGGFIETVFVIIVFFMTLSGWNQIKRSSSVEPKQI